MRKLILCVLTVFQHERPIGTILHSFAWTEMNVKNFLEGGIHVQELEKVFVLWFEFSALTNQRVCCK